MACLVVFCTTYALILPAITLEKSTYCGKVEHTHDDSCYVTNLACTIEKGEGHTHTEDCYRTERTLICQMEEGPDHLHTDECYETVRELICPLEESEGHIHTAECYERVLTCTLEEHTHSPACYANQDADLETKEQWEKTLPEKLTGVWADDLLAVAKSQLDYAESETNFQIVDGSPSGYTRYGAWYGFPYESWCGMYIAFCMHYAGIPKDAMPFAAACSTWVSQLTEKKMYRVLDDTMPDPGDMIFFDFDEDGTADHVGIVTGADEEKGLDTIEGNSEDKVAKCHYDWDDPKLLGYGLLPENPEPPKEILMKDLLRKLGSDVAEAEGGDAYDFSLPEGGYVNLQSIVEVLGIADEDTEQTAKAPDESALTLDEIEISDKTKEFVESVEKVSFSRPDLVWVGKVESDTTVERLKNENDLEPQYSEELTDSQIAEVNATKAEAGDWALISQKPFLGEQTLTVTTSEGEEYEITVRDGQISQIVLAADGQTYEVLVTYGADAQIPDGAELQVSEILEGTAHYHKYLTQTAKELGTEAEDIAFARFFDIDIVSGGEKIEPAAEVSVKITLADAASEPLQIVHFTEEKIALIDAEQKAVDANGGTQLQFLTDGFSTYGVITGPAPSGVNNLDGYTVKIGIGNRYVLSSASSATNPPRLGKGDEANAAEWTFEATGTQGVYNISTMVNGQKRYMNISQYNNGTQQGSVTVSANPQGLRVTQDNNGNYQISATVNGITFYLNEDSGANSSNGFTAWYAQNDNNARLKFTFAQPTLTTDDQYMVLVKIEGDYYIVLNNGELEKVENPVNGSVNTVSAETPLFWTYTDNVLYHMAEAVGFTFQNLTSDYYYCYLDPRQDNGLTVETRSDVVVRNEGDYGDVVTTRKLWDSVKIVYDENNHSLVSASDPTKKLKFVEDKGVYRIAGGDAEGFEAEVYLAKRSDPNLQYGWTYHTVNHIDISVEARAVVKVPLAYGAYYYIENGQIKTLDVSAQNPITLNLSMDDVPVTKEDLRNGQLIAYVKNADGTQTILPNAYMITGYSGNDTNDISTDQVRIDGIFKVANLEPVPNNGSGNGNYTWRQRRLANRVYYSVSTTKDLTFNMEYNNHQLFSSLADAEAALAQGSSYDADKDDNALKVRSDVTLATSFDYWDSRNECPPLQGNGDWRSGDLFSDPSILSQGIGHNTNSGMDFALSTSDESTTNALAIEITKYLVDVNGNLITPDRQLKHTFHVYRKEININASNNPINEVQNMNVGEYNGVDPSYSNYVKLHDKTVTVGNGGFGIIYDYDVLPGMIYVEEDTGEDSLQEVITDRNGKDWNYKGTYLETEYVWRDDQYTNETVRHVSKTYYTSEDGAYNSIPDVLGDYKDVNGVNRRNGFLEFYVYNVYDRDNIDIPVQKTWEHENGTVAEAPDGAEVTVTLGRYKLVEDENNPVTGTLEIHQAFTGDQLGPDDVFQATYEVKRNGITIKSANYDPDAFAGGGGAVITGLQPGEYTVEVSSSVLGYEVANTVTPVNPVIQTGATTPVNVTSNITTSHVQGLIPVVVTNSSPGAPNYQTITGSYPAGSSIAVHISRRGPGHNTGLNVSVQVEGQDGNYPQPGGNSYTNITQIVTFTLPSSPLPDGEVYNIDFTHDWDRSDFWIDSVTPLVSGSGSSNSTNQTNQTNRLMSVSPDTSFSTLSVDNTLSLDSPQSADSSTRASPAVRAAPSLRALPVSVLRAEGTPQPPASPIPGWVYTDDETWTSEPLVLNAAPWKEYLKDQLAVDEHGYPYRYYIKSVSEEGVPIGTTFNIDMDGSSLETSNGGDETVHVTNILPNEPPKISVQKVDENGRPMSGATFVLERYENNAWVEVEVKEITTVNGLTTFDGIPAGSYRIRETQAPTGYFPIQNEFATFTVTPAPDLAVDNLVINDPDHISYDAPTLTFSVTNIPETPGQIVVRKQWLDFYENPTTYDDTLDLTLRQWAPGALENHRVTVYIRCVGDGSGNNNTPGRITEIGSRTGTGKGDVRIIWDWDQWTQEQPFDVDWPDYTSAWSRGPNIQSDGRSGGRQTVTLRGIDRNVTVYLTIRNGGWKGTDNNLIQNLEFTGSSSAPPPLTPTGGTKTVTLGQNGAWSQSFTVNPNLDALLSDSSNPLPGKYNGNTCYYTISEDSIPEGYTLKQITNYDTASTQNPIEAGALTAINKRTTAEITVVKVDEKNKSTRLNGAKFELRQINAQGSGNIDTRYTVNGIQYVEANGTALETSGEGTLVFPDLETGYYEIKEIMPPSGYVLKSDSAFYILVSNSGITLLEKDLEKPARQWREIGYTSMVSFENGTATVSNHPAPSLPHSGGVGTSGFRIYGLLLLLPGALLYYLRLRRRKERRSSA